MNSKPVIVKVRFAEFTANLLRAFVRSISICLHYWKHLSESNESNREEKNKSKGFLNTWLSKDKLQLIHTCPSQWATCAPISFTPPLASNHFQEMHLSHKELNHRYYIVGWNIVSV